MVNSFKLSTSDFAASIASDQVDDMRRTVETYTIPMMLWTTGGPTTTAAAPATDKPATSKPAKPSKGSKAGKGSKKGSDGKTPAPTTQAAGGTTQDLSAYCTKHEDCTYLGAQFICDLGDLGGTYQCIWSNPNSPNL